MDTKIYYQENGHENLLSNVQWNASSESRCSWKCNVDAIGNEF